MKEYHLVAMIPARMGSKRIPNKNTRYLCGKPLIQYPIDLALGCTAFKSVYVNTESTALGYASKKMGVSFYHRSDALAADHATNRDFVYDFLKNVECDYVVMMNPTAPALRPQTVECFVQYLRNNDYDTILSVVSIQAEAFYMGKPVNFNKQQKINSQLLEPIYETVWALTAWKRNMFMTLYENNQCPVFGGKLGRFVIPKDEACDIDTEEDWNIAEGLLTARQIQASKEHRYLKL